jgi:hypothetical protein
MYAALIWLSAKKRYSYFQHTSEIKAQSKPDAARAQGSGRHEKAVEEGLLLRRCGGRTQGVEVDEFGTEGEDGFVQILYRTTLK